ncbi:thymidylate synthase [Candidatus Saccharibacteria bacterium]|nr:thymidylate synthase [Candidatus Saccharibacteria bacterium]
MASFDEQYINLCKNIIKNGEEVTNYKKTDNRSEKSALSIPDHSAQGKSSAKTIRLPHQFFQFDLSKEYPILRSKKVAFKTAVLEILWIYQVASNDVRWLRERGVKIWDEWEISESGEYMGKNINKLYKDLHPSLPEENFAHTIGTAYGWIVKKYSLIENLLETLKSNPGNRRMVLSLWQNEWLPTAALPSCVWNSQWNMTNGRLNLLVTSRSSDVPLGLPFNIVQYAVLCCLIAQSVGVEPGQFTFITNDAHIYENQLDGIREQISRYDKAMKTGTLPEPPKLVLNPEIKDFYSFDNSKELKDIRLENYNHLGVIKMPVTE